MNPPKKLTTQQQAQDEQQEAVQGLQQSQQAQAGKEFASVEEMLRHDALHTPVPPAIGRRLERSIGPKGPAAGPWWRRWFGGT